MLLACFLLLPYLAKSELNHDNKFHNNDIGKSSPDSSREDIFILHSSSLDVLKLMERTIQSDNPFEKI